MGYIQNSLSQGEEVIYEAKIHWFIFIRPIFFIMLGGLFYPTQSKALHIAAIVILILGIIDLLRKFLLKSGSQYVVTNKKVILKSGIIKRDALELLLQKCEGIRVNQGILGRIFSFGSILVTTGGVSNVFRYVSNPMKFKQAINNQIQ